MGERRGESFSGRMRSITNQMHYHHGTSTVSHKDKPLTHDEKIEQEMKEEKPNDQVQGVSGEPIKEEKIQFVLQEEMTKYQNTNVFTTEASKKLCEEMKTRLKCISQGRYKYIVHVTSGTCKKQGVRVVSSCLWEVHTDGSYSVQFKGNGHFTVVTAYVTHI